LILKMQVSKTHLFTSARSFSAPSQFNRSVSFRSNFQNIQTYSISPIKVNSNPLFKSLIFVSKRNITVVPTDLEQIKEQKRMTKRPISPHVTIYKFPLPALTSITTRITGVGLTIGAYGAGLSVLWGSPHTLSFAIETIKVGYPILVPLVKCLIAFPLVYHTLFGIRHLYWDYTAQGIDTKSVEQTSIYLIAATAILTLGFTFYSI